MANKIGGLVTKFAKTEKMLIVAIMVIVGIMSGFLSNTGTAAVLIPGCLMESQMSLLFQKPPSVASWYLQQHLVEIFPLLAHREISWV